ILSVVISTMSVGLLSLLLFLKSIPLINLLGGPAHYDSIYGVFMPLMIGAAGILLNRVIYTLYRRQEDLRRRAEEENEQAVTALVLAEKTRLEVEAYSDFARMLNSARPLDEKLNSIFDYIARNFGTEANVLFLFDSNRNEFYHYKSRLPEYATPEQREYLENLRMPFAEGGGAHWLACSRQRYVYFPHIRPSVLSAIDQEVVTNLNLASILIIPLIIQGEIFGIIDFSNQSRPLKLKKPDIESISAFCEQIAGAVRSALLVHEAQAAREASERARAEVERLNDFTVKINSATNLDVILDYIFTYIENHYNLEGIWLQFVDTDNNELYTYKHTRPRQMSADQVEFLRNLRLSLSDDGSIICDVYRRQKHFYLPRRPRSFIYETDRKIFDRLNMESVMIVPLIIGEETVAIVTFTRYQERMNLSREDIRSLTIFCHQIAGAIYSSHLHSESEISRMVAEQSLQEVRELKNQQDLDYYLTSNLIEPLGRAAVNSETSQVRQFVRQKKRFPYMRWTCEIGGDFCSAHTIYLQGRPFTMFINADAMGKSLQGAGGILVLGSVLHNIIDRTPELRYPYPEQWLKNAYIDLDRVFRAFEGSMYITALIGLMDDATGALYYVHAEHPLPVLYRGGKAEFITPRFRTQKLGFLLGELVVRINMIRLLPGDFLVIGSDGREDIMLRGNEMNTDETLFLRALEEAGGDLEKVYTNLRTRGMITDDLSLLGVQYDNRYGNYPADLSPEVAREVLVQARREWQQGSYRRVLELLRKPAELILITECGHLDDVHPEYGDIVELVVQAAYREGLHSEGRALAQEYLRMNPLRSELVRYRSLFDGALDELDSAIDFGERFFLREPDDAEIIEHLISLYVQIKNKSRVDYLYRRLMQMEGLEEIKKRVGELIRSAWTF
ncbi:MAG: SpoIIE family protein phosphatase, partial [Leptospiraceae bacterium]|nr:SpoIIE family protein phosphatase [Leptospiraceae bacterium]